MSSTEKLFSDDEVILFKLYTVIHSAIKEIAYDRLVKYADHDQIKMDQLEPGAVQKSDRWVIIMMAGTYGIHMVFSCYFSDETAEKLYKRRFNNRTSPQEVHYDFIAEYCNLTVGAVKSALATLIQQHYGFSSNTKLQGPEKRPSADVPPTDRRGLNKMTWALNMPEGKLIITSQLELNEKEIVGGFIRAGGIEKFISAISTLKIDQSGDVELF